jgi:hypothetical protein
LIMRIKSAITYLVATLMHAPFFPVARAFGPVSVRVGVLLVWLGVAAGGCTSRTAVPDPARSPVQVDGQGVSPLASIAAVHRRKCGNCHTRVEPGSLPRATIEAAMVRHRRRAKLTDGQWAELIEFLSRGPSEPRHTASLP